MRKWIRVFVVMALALCMLFAVACAPKQPNEGTVPAGSETEAGPGTEGTTSAKGLKIAIVTTSGVDDGSFGQGCYEGILEFIAKNPGSTVVPVKEPDNSKVLQAVADIIADYDVLVLPGFQFAPVGINAKDNPNTKIILVDTAPTDEENKEVSLDNVYAMTFAEQESGFFAGVAAALETRTNKVASVHGMAFPPVVNYQFGFESGVNYANKHFGTKAEIIALPSYGGTDVTGAKVGSNYVGDFADEATGKLIGKTLYDSGCDIIFVAAGASGNGVFTAAKEETGVFCIGCDVDQYDDGNRGDGTNIILTSALKVMHTNVDKQLQKILDGTFEGKNEQLNVQTDSTGYVTADGRHQMSKTTLDKLMETYALVKSGKIVPASNFNGHKPDNFPGLEG